ncbi:LytTR family transcriptional regulator [Lactiplantibacillus garii]|uniref:LytTR family transcriptional regulator n=1 Tax=Lactiplantibacillus garii TaxID=2306423 RepID=A0A3R8KDW0_9LACO|nr:LytTR family transcriptional regulator [Lactiplantibacillus garii]RRK10014.1 LytTR family transcriptional regulator [Lactiplantibacillus garii]
MSAGRVYVAIDLKSFYASVECVAHHLDPLNANLVVADTSRTDKTICLAVSPALKKFGVPGRPRLFEVEQRVRQLNRERARYSSYQHVTRYQSIYRRKLLKSPGLGIDYRVVPPRMHYYMQKSAEIYDIYLRFIKPKNIHVYSIDEVFMDVTDYLQSHHVTAHTLVKTIIHEIQAMTGITATAGIGTNLYLAKVAMDIVAKKIPAGRDGVRIAQMNEHQYRQYLWSHQPLTDFWRVGRGYAKRLNKLGLKTMGDVARCSLGSLSDHYNEEVLYREFGKNAELLIDHAWGYEAATLADIKSYQASEHGIYASQVLMTPYPYEQGRQVLRGMVDALALDLVARRVVTDQIGIRIDYDIQSLQTGHYHGTISTDYYGRQVPKPAHENVRLRVATSAPGELQSAYQRLYQQTADQQLFIRRITVMANHLVDEQRAAQVPRYEQTSLFEDPQHAARVDKRAQQRRARDHKLQETILQLQKQSGNKNVVVRLADLTPGATTLERNAQIGGHRA